MLAASENEPECCQVWGINRDKRGLQGKDSPKGIEYPKVSLNPAPPKKTQLIVSITQLPLNCTVQCLCCDDQASPISPLIHF